VAIIDYFARLNACALGLRNRKPAISLVR